MTPFPKVSPIPVNRPISTNSLSSYLNVNAALPANSMTLNSNFCQPEMHTTKDDYAGSFSEGALETLSTNTAYFAGPININPSLPAGQSSQSSSSSSNCIINNRYSDGDVIYTDSNLDDSRIDQSHANNLSTIDHSQQNFEVHGFSLQQQSRNPLQPVSTSTNQIYQSHKYQFFHPQNSFAQVDQVNASHIQPPHSYQMILQQKQQQQQLQQQHPSQNSTFDMSLLQELTLLPKSPMNNNNNKNNNNMNQSCSPCVGMLQLLQPQSSSQLNQLGSNQDYMVSKRNRLIDFMRSADIWRETAQQIQGNLCKKSESLREFYARQSEQAIAFFANLQEHLETERASALSILESNLQSNLHEVARVSQSLSELTASCTNLYEDVAGNLDAIVEEMRSDAFENIMNSYVAKLLELNAFSNQTSANLSVEIFRACFDNANPVNIADVWSKSIESLVTMNTATVNLMRGDPLFHPETISFVADQSIVNVPQTQQQSTVNTHSSTGERNTKRSISSTGNTSSTNKNSHNIAGSNQHARIGFPCEIQTGATAITSTHSIERRNALQGNSNPQMNGKFSKASRKNSQPQSELFLTKESAVVTEYPVKKRTNSIYTNVLKNMFKPQTPTSIASTTMATATNITQNSSVSGSHLIPMGISHSASATNANAKRIQLTQILSSHQLGNSNGQNNYSISNSNHANNNSSNNNNNSYDRQNRSAIDFTQKQQQHPNNNNSHVHPRFL